MINDGKIGVGDEVVCVDSSIRPDTLIELTRDVPNWVVKGKKYIVREILENDGIVTSILLEEIHNPPLFFRLLNKFQEPGFALWRFAKTQSAYTIEEERVAAMQKQTHAQEIETQLEESIGFPHERQ